MASSITQIEQFERVLLRRGVGALAAGRNCCEDCGRTPLVGERMHVYEESRRQELVCELCRPARREQPSASRTVRHSEHGHAVRLAAHAAWAWIHAERASRSRLRRGGRINFAPVVVPVTSSIVIDAPRERIFAYLQDIANHSEFTDHYLVDWHLTRADSVGQGAGARFRVTAPRNRFSWGDVTFVEVKAPHRIVEAGRTGKGNRIRTLGVYELSPGPAGTTKVQFTLETEPGALSDRLMEALGGRSWVKRKNARAMRSARHGRRRVDCRVAMSGLPRKSCFAALALIASLALGACGDSHTRVSTGTYAGESGANAPYLNVGPLVYEVQLSRALNPADTEDASYLQGLTPFQRELAPGEEWFAVFLQVYNETGQPHNAATSLTITDTQGNLYKPITPGEANQFAYRAGSLEAKSQIPAPNSVAASGPTQGALLLYKIKVQSLDNRPLELKIVDPDDPSQSASAELDV
jgi:uncharacterized protein YndB with AHSA1/START domain